MHIIYASINVCIHTYMDVWMHRVDNLISNQNTFSVPVTGIVVLLPSTLRSLSMTDFCLNFLQQT